MITVGSGAKTPNSVIAEEQTSLSEAWVVESAIQLKGQVIDFGQERLLA
jgi:hypothetical protein